MVSPDSHQRKEDNESTGSDGSNVFRDAEEGVPPLEAPLMDSDCLIPLSNSTDESIPSTAEMINGMKLTELKVVCKNNKLGVGGKKKYLQDRVLSRLEEGK